MKKNRMLRLASTLTILTLLTTSIIGGTFAKYTTNNSARDTARVAKWGVVIETSGSLYSNAYANVNAADGDLPAAWADREDFNKVTVAAASQGDNILAPGTKNAGDGLSFSVSGTPEVAVEVTTNIAAEDIYLAKGTYGVLVPMTIDSTPSLKKAVRENADGIYRGDVGNNYSKMTETDAHQEGQKYYVLTNKVAVPSGGYFPVKYTLKSDNTTDNREDLTAVTVTKLLAEKIKENANTSIDENYNVQYQQISKKFPANTDLSSEKLALSGVKLGWKWPFESNEDNNKKDTILGDLSAARGAIVNYVVVSVDTTSGTVTPLTVGTGDDYTVKIGNNVVANLRTMFDISLTVTQLD